MSGNAFVSEREIWGWNLWTKSDTVLPSARHRYDISLKEAVLPWSNDAEIAPPPDWLHASAYYNE